jgi:hypothetical protein
LFMGGVINPSISREMQKAKQDSSETNVSEFSSNNSNRNADSTAAAEPSPISTPEEAPPSENVSGVAESPSYLAGVGATAAVEPTPGSTAEEQASSAKTSGDSISPSTSDTSTAIAEPTPPSMPTAELTASPERPATVPLNEVRDVSETSPVYKEADSNSPILDSIHQGKRVRIIGEAGNYFLIRKLNGIVGFISSSSVN